MDEIQHYQDIQFNRRNVYISFGSAVFVILVTALAIYSDDPGLRMVGELIIVSGLFLTYLFCVMGCIALKELKKAAAEAEQKPEPVSN